MHPDFDLVPGKPLEPDFIEMVKGLIPHLKVSEPEASTIPDGGRAKVVRSNIFNIFFFKKKKNYSRTSIRASLGMVQKALMHDILLRHLEHLPLAHKVELGV